MHVSFVKPFSCLASAVIRVKRWNSALCATFCLLIQFTYQSCCVCMCVCVFVFVCVCVYVSVCVCACVCALCTVQDPAYWFNLDITAALNIDSVITSGGCPVPCRGHAREKPYKCVFVCLCLCLCVCMCMCVCTVCPAEAMPEKSHTNASAVDIDFQRLRKLRIQIQINSLTRLFWILMMWFSETTCRCRNRGRFISN